jgi:predicted O-linked N-acetylglucosamine transferase (SPINDLY family)
LAVRAHQAGQRDHAAGLLRQLLRSHPRHADGLNLLGGIALQSGDPGEAADLIEHAIGIDADNPVYRYNLGLALRRAGRLDEAAASYREAIARRPDYPEALYNLGSVLAALGSFEEAIPCFRRVLAINPTHVNALVNLGAALTREDQMDEAAICYRRAIALDPRIANAHYNLGKLVQEQGELDEAVGHYEAALECQPDFLDALSNLGNTLLALDRAEEAAAVVNRAISLSPDCAEAFANLASVLRHQQRLEESRAAGEAAVRLKPDLAEAHVTLGATLHELGELETGNAALETAIRLAPDNPAPHTLLIMGLHYQAAVSEAAIVAAARRFEAQIAVRPNRHFLNSPEAGRRLRVGYVSADFKAHPVGFLLAPVLAHHDREAIEVFGYSNGIRRDWLTRQLREQCNGWRSLTGLSDSAAAAIVAADGIDILVDLSGHTGGNRLAMFARKPAPVQLSWLGFWGTTGLSAIDYILSDATMIPEGEEDLYSETVFRLPDGRFCYGAPHYAPAPAPPPCRAGGAVTFGSFNNVRKLGGDVIELWARVLQATPGARLLLKSAALADTAVRGAILAAFMDRGVTAERLILRGSTPHADMLAEYADVDIALDPFPFSGGMTSCEALWMGVPIVTLPGKRAVSRQTLGFLRVIGLPELAAASADDYVRIASSLAADLPRLAAMRASLRQRMAGSPLCDGATFARKLEAAYRTMWQAWCATIPDPNRSPSRGA